MRWIVRIVSGVFMLALVVAGLVMLVPTEEIARRAAAQVEAATGRALNIEGPVKASLWPGLAVETGAIRLANADWAGDAPMIAAEGLRIELDTAALVGGAVRITGLELAAPRIRLERHRDGRANWDILPADGGGAPGTGGGPADFSLAEARIKGGRISFTDHAGGARVDLQEIDATLRLPDLAGTAELALSARLAGQAVALDLVAAPASALMSGARAQGRVALRAGGSSVDFDGGFGHAPLQAEGELRLDAADRRALAALIGQPLPELPQGFGARVLRLEGRAALTPDLRLSLRDGVAVLDETRLRLSGDLVTADAKPRLTATIEAETPLTIPSSSGGGATGAGWSTERIDLGALHALDADLGFAAPGITAAGLRLGATRGRMVLTDGRAEITLAEVRAYEGRASGTVVVNGRGRGSASAKLVLEDIALQPLLRDTAGYDRLIARVDGTVSLLSSAASVSEMMHRLQGEGRLGLGKGELRGLDLVGMLRTLDVGYVGEGQRTIFDGVSSGFSIAEGVLRADDLKLSAPYVSVEGRGTVGIGTRTLDYRLVPVALRKEDGSGGVTVPLMITGPWDAPRFRLDLEALAKPKIEAEKARAEEKLKQELARKAEEKLGIRAEEGERLEDAAKRKLEQEVIRGLGRLLGGN